MKILIAPDSFKESLSAALAAAAIAQGVRQALPAATIDRCPIADGGEGTVEALVDATRGVIHTHGVTGPTGAPVEARWGMLGDQQTAVIEMAAAAGLALVPPDLRDPSATTTYGVGELILAAADQGAGQILIGIGGSATNDGGLGMAQALGYKLDGATAPACGSDARRVWRIDDTVRDARLDTVKITVACDVTNPLTGPEGASAVYGPQKGATPEMIAQLDAGLAHMASLIDGVDPDQPGMGAAGGLGFGLVAFAGATLRRGIDLVLDAVGFDQRVRGADLVITGEGRLDGQSIQGKACIGVAQAAARFDVPTLALVGSVGDGAARTLDHGLNSYHPLVRGDITTEQAMARPQPLLTELAAEVMARYAGRA